MVKEKDTVLPNSSVNQKTLPKLKTALIKSVLLNTSDSTPKPVRLRITLLRVLLASFYDLKNNLPSCEILARDGVIFIKIHWQKYWLDFDKEKDLVLAELADEKEN